MKVVTLSRNFGHQMAITAGLDHASGDAVVMIDADLQDPPELIPTMIEHWRAGSDVVYTMRTNREGESRFKVVTARWFYGIMGRVSAVPLASNSGDFRLLSRRALDALLTMREANRYLRGMTSWVGFTQTALPYERAARHAGKTKYPIRKMVHFALDAIASFSNVPLQLATVAGFIFAAIAFLAVPVAIGFRIFGQFLPGITTTVVAVLLLGGFQLIAIGLIGEYVGRIYDEVKRRPLYIVSRRANVAPPRMSASAPPPARDMTVAGRPAGRQRALTAVGATISLAALAGVIFWALHQEPPSLPDSTSQIVALVAAIVVYLAGCAARGERWQELLEHNGVDARRADTYSLVAVGYLGNNVLPARAGDALRVFFLTPRVRADARAVIGTIVAERLLDVVLLVGLFVVLAYGVLGGIDIAVGGPLRVRGAHRGGVDRRCSRRSALVLHRRGRLRHALDFLAPMGEATRRMRGRHGVALLAWSSLIWGLEWGAWWLAAQAAGLDLGVLDVGYLMGLATIFVLVPSGPGYVGTFDAAIVFGLHALGHTESALSFLLLLRFVIAVPITLIGLAASAGRFGGVARMRAAVRA